MKKGSFCYIKDQYFLDFSDNMLMKNKEVINGKEHNRPCFYVMKDDDSEILWLIPISSRIKKYEEVFKKKKEKYGYCDTLIFGNVLGKPRVFLIQNMCPITEEYINNIYYDTQGNLVQIETMLESKIISCAKNVLKKTRKGKKIIFPDVLTIEQQLLKKENEKKADE